MHLTFAAAGAAIGVKVEMVPANCFPVFFNFFLRSDAKSQLNIMQLCLFGCREKTIVTDTYKTFREDMLAKTPEKLNTVEGHNFLHIVAIVAVTEGDHRFVNGKNAMIADSHLVGVPAKIFHNLLWPCKGHFSIHNPVSFV
jgi:hypothetical protein